jgi:hypothetical protein
MGCDCQDDHGAARPHACDHFQHAPGELMDLCVCGHERRCHAIEE